jgi:hypothetical protein
MIDKTTAQHISTESVKALQEVAEKFDLTVTAGRGAYDDTMFEIKMIFKTADADLTEFGRYAPSFGLQPEHFGATFLSRGLEYKITGIAPKNWKRPILCERADGSKFKFPAETVAAALQVQS